MKSSEYFILVFFSKGKYKTKWGDRTKFFKVEFLGSKKNMMNTTYKTGE